MTFATIYWFRADSLLSKFIRRVTRSEYSHVAIYVDGCMYEAVGGGLFCWTGEDADKRIGEAVAFRTIFLEHQRAEMMQMWLDKVTDETSTKTHPLLGGYSVAGFIAAGIGAMTGRRIVVGLADEYICSGLVATALWRAWVDMPHDPKTMTPEDLARLFKPHMMKR